MMKWLPQTHPDVANATLGTNATGGRDYVVGDVHGEFELLEEALERIGFAADSDRLFCVGDLIDRGGESARALEWLESGQIEMTVRGNHEQMMAEAFAAGETVHTRLDGPGQNWSDNGGHWWYESEAVQAQRENSWVRTPFEPAKRWSKALRAMPWTMTVDVGVRRVGIVHSPGFATMASSWRAVLGTVQAQHDAGAAQATETGARLHWPDWTVWLDAPVEHEERAHPDMDAALPGIDLVVCGHTPGRHPRWSKSNVVCIDTGAHYEELNHLTIAELTGPRLVLHRHPKND